jgi:phosphoglycolate phosphatase
MNSLRGIVYDCDGVLFESRRANLAYYNLVLDHFGLPRVAADDPERCQLCHTASSPKVLEVLVEPELLPAALAFSATVDYRQFLHYMDPEPGMAETLQLLARRFPLAVATNRGTSMPEILRHFELGRYFTTVVTCRDVARPKPHPDMLLLAAERLDCNAGQLLFVGDSELDMQAAREAGMPFVAYRSRLPGVRGIDHHAALVELLEDFSPAL